MGLRKVTSYDTRKIDSQEDGQTSPPSQLMTQLENMTSKTAQALFGIYKTSRSESEEGKICHGKGQPFEGKVFVVCITQHSSTGSLIPYQET